MLSKFKPHRRVRLFKSKACLAAVSLFLTAWIFLLTLAAVSPGLHAWLHGASAEEAICSGSGHVHTEGQNSSDAGVHAAHFCGVMALQSGLIYLPFITVTPERVVLASIPIRPGRTFSFQVFSCNDPARAPPIESFV
ncbi:MAG: hypothetical protein ACI81V_001131 [Lentimonas sp.]|jgi:hypothetical protein